MKKSKFSKILILLIVMCLCCSMLILTACNETNYEFEKNKEGEDKQLVANGDFTFATGDEYPRSPVSWTGSINGSGNYVPEGGVDVIKAGMINIGKDYEYSKSKWENYPNPNTHEGAVDSNILMINNKQPSSYKFASSSVTVKAGKYYRLVFWVNTGTDLNGELDENGTLLNNVDYGAYIKVAGDGISGEWIDIKTNGKWQKFEMYIEGAKDASKSFSITFGLGYGDKTDKHLTKGHAFFDDVVIEELEDIKNEAGVVTKTAKQQFDEAKGLQIPTTEKESYIYKDSYRFPNQRFTGYNKYSTSLPYNPLNFNSGYGGVDDDKATLSYKKDITNEETGETETVTIKATKKNGIVSLSKDDFEKNKEKYGFSEDMTWEEFVGRSDATEQILNTDYVAMHPGAIDNNALMLYLDKDCAINYVSNSSFVVEKGKIYEFSIWVKTFNNVDSTARGTIILSNDDEEYRLGFDNEKFYKDGKEAGLLQREEGGWAKMVFNIRGNSTHDVTYKLTLALGTDGLSQKENWSNGHVFFDDITFAEKQVSSTDATTASIDNWAMNDNNCYNIDLSEATADSPTIKNGIQNGNLIDTKAPETIDGRDYTLPENFDINHDDSKQFFGKNRNNSINVVDGTSTDNKDTIGLPYEVVYEYGTTPKFANNVLAITSKNNATLALDYNKEISAKMNLYYRLAFWVKTADIQKELGMNFYLDQMDEKDKVVTTTKIENVNSANISKDSGNENGWQEVVFYIAGSFNNDTNFKLRLQYGKGDIYDDLPLGSVYIYNINLQSIDYTAYNNASTGSLVKKVDLSSDNKLSITNGEFNKITNKKGMVDSNGNLVKFGTPSNWSVNNDRIPSDLDDQLKNVKHGVLDITSMNTIKKILGDDKLADDLFNPTLLNELNETAKDTGMGRYVLAMYSPADNKVIYNYKSNSISLDANSYYKIMVSAYSAAGAEATVKLSSSSPHQEGLDYFTLQENKGGWTQYTFYIKTGLNSANVNLILSLGNLDKHLHPVAEGENKQGTSSGLVLFDRAMMTKFDTEKGYNADKATRPSEDKTFMEMSFNADGFATSSYDKDKLNSVNGWNTNPITNAPEIDGEDSTLVGILDLDRYNEEEIWGYATNSEAGALDKLRQERVNRINAIKNADNGYDYNIFGSSVLMIDNLTDTGYSIVNSSAKTLAKNKYYKISIYVYVFLDEPDKKEVTDENNYGLNLSLKIGDRDQDTIKINNIKSTNKWKEYSFYVKNVNDIKDTSLSAYLTMQLGTRKTEGDKDIPQFVKGTVFADNFTIEEIKEDAFNAAKEKDEASEEIATIEYVPDKDIDNETEDKEEKPTNEVDWKTLAWAIPTIVLAVILIIVLGVFLYKKYANPKHKTKFKGKKPKTKKTEIKRDDNFNNFND